MKAHWAYLKYVLRHKWFVFLAGRKLGVSWWQLLIHDWTKFLPCEWGPYVQSFYNADGSKRDWKSRTEQDKEEFDAAWNHHQKVNKHHWQYWCLVTDSDEPRLRALPIPMKYVREMVADWVGAGRAITGKVEVWEWYVKNREKMVLHPTTQLQVHELVGRIQDELILDAVFTPL
jgi:hypothetical protein